MEKESAHWDIQYTKTIRNSLTCEKINPNVSPQLDSGTAPSIPSPPSVPRSFDNDEDLDYHSSTYLFWTESYSSAKETTALTAEDL